MFWRKKKAWLFPKLRFLGNKVYLLFLTEFIASVIMIFLPAPKRRQILCLITFPLYGTQQVVSQLVSFHNLPVMEHHKGTML